MNQASKVNAGIAICAVTVMTLTWCTGGGSTAAPSGAGTWFQPQRPTISVAASAFCPKRLGSARDVPDHSAGSTTLLPTTGAPSSALVCSYRNRDLTAQTRLGTPAARELATAVDKIDLAAPHGEIACPEQGDDVTIIAFGFSGSDEVDLWWADSGCQTLDNGRLGAFWAANPSFYTNFWNTYSRLVPISTTPAGRPVGPVEQPRRATA